jgi:alpha-1,2-rhamnosyltransferase
MNLYIDCTETHKTKLNTGIQRVVKNITHLSKGEPIIFDGIGFLPILSEDLNPGRVQLIKKTREIIVNFPLLYPFAKNTFKTLLKIKTLLSYPVNYSRYLNFRSGDVLLCADIIHDKGLVKALRKLDIPVYQVVYDVLPLDFPEFFPDKSAENFKKVANMWPTYAKKLYAISKKVAEEVQEKLNVPADHFYLGSDFVDKDSERITPRLSNYCLAVGTIEPRKNHIHIIKTFFQLWESGSDKKLVFIGRKGWKFEKIVEFVSEAEKKYPDNFLWLNDCDDVGLESYYHGADVVICASYDEGFGLPVVEALSRKKNVICSDIKVFKEIGTQYCTYFNDQITGDGSLFEIIKTGNYKKDVSDFKWITWKESVDILVDKIRKDNS